MENIVLCFLKIDSMKKEVNEPLFSVLIEKTKCLNGSNMVIWKTGNDLERKKKNGCMNI